MKTKCLKGVILTFAIILSTVTSFSKEKEDVTIIPEITSSYHIVHIKGDFNIESRPSTDTLKIIAKENIVELLECAVVNDTLTINFVKGKGTKAIVSAKAPVIYLPQNPDVKKIMLAGAAYMESSTVFNAESFDFKLSGTSRLIMPVNVKELSVFCAGTSNVTFTGQSEVFKIRIDGASRVSACEGFECKIADLDINGAGVVRINCTDALIGETSGVSVVRYLNDPKELNIKSNGINGVAKIK